MLGKAAGAESGFSENKAGMRPQRSAAPRVTERQRAPDVHEEGSG